MGAISVSGTKGMFDSLVVVLKAWVIMYHQSVSEVHLKIIQLKANKLRVKNWSMVVSIWGYLCKPIALTHCCRKGCVIRANTMVMPCSKPNPINVQAAPCHNPTKK